jgi:hypothetical protein
MVVTLGKLWSAHAPTVPVDELVVVDDGDDVADEELEEVDELAEDDELEEDDVDDDELVVTPLVASLVSPEDSSPLSFADPLSPAVVSEPVPCGPGPEVGTPEPPSRLELI